MKQKQIRLFASDMDGTLLKRDFSISGENIRAIRQLEEAGIYFVIATGRIWHDAHEICRSHGLEPFIISNNGTCAFLPDGRQIYSKPIENDRVIELTQLLEQREMCYGLGTANHFLANDDWEMVFDAEMQKLVRSGIEIPPEKVAFAKQELLEQNGVLIVPEVQSLLAEKGPVYSISLETYDAENVEVVRGLVEQDSSLVVSVSGAHNVEIMKRDGTKAHALKALCKELGISLDETAAIGDSLNDFHMIESAGTGIAVGNARGEIKEISDFVTERFDSHGVAHAIHMILDNQ